MIRIRGEVRRYALRPIAYSVMLACASGASANPVGPSVAAGAATFQANGKTLNVTNAPGTIINWRAFSIGAGEQTRFLQQSASSAVLNRVVGSDASSILGALSSNGRVFLVNPHGIVFGAGARIDTAGFIASTLNITDRDFLQGKLKFEGGGNGILRNEGAIRASGDIMLVGPVIENAGIIRSDSGAVLLAAGKSVTITSPDAQGVKFELQAPTDTALNLGTIEASGAASMLAGTLRHSGDIRASSASAEGARVVLSAQKEAIVDAGATISANGAHGGNVMIESGDMTLVSGRVETMGAAGPGGTVQVLGKRVGVFEGGSIDASGTSGGGTILVGGDYQGRNSEVQNAWRTFVGPDAQLRADAIASGDGGKVIVWADDVTRFHGAISARGGAQSGDGGFIETSGKESLIVAGGRVDARAPKGRVGTWLLDPKDIVVGNGGTDSAADVSAFGNATCGGTNNSAMCSITPATLNGAGASVTLQANNDIIFNAAVELQTLNAGLTAQAGRSIEVNAGIKTNNGTVMLTANEVAAAGVNPAQRDPGPGLIVMNAGAQIDAGVGNVLLRVASGNGRPSGPISVSTISGGNVSVVHEGIDANKFIAPTHAGSRIIGSTAVHLALSAGGAAGSIGAPFAPINIRTPALEAQNETGGGIFIASPEPGDLQIGGVAFYSGPVRGLQTLNASAAFPGAGGPIVLTVNGNLSRFQGSLAPCGSSAGATGGPICANNGNITLTAAQIGTPVAGGRMHVDTGGGPGFNQDPHGTVIATSTVGGVFLRRRNLPLDISGHIVSVPAGQPIDLAADSRIAVDADMNFPGSAITLMPGMNNIVGFTGATVTAQSLNVATSGNGEMQIVGGNNTVDAQFSNTSTVALNGGTLALTGNGTDSGVYRINAGTALKIAGGTRSFSGAMFSGEGAFTINGGTANFATAATFAGPLTLSAGVLGGPGMVTAGNGLTFNGGTIASGGNVMVAGGTTTISAGSPSIAGMLDARTLNMSGGTLSVTGTLTIPGDGMNASLVSNENATINNAGVISVAGNWMNSGTLTLTEAGQISPIPNTPFVFTNLAGGIVNLSGNNASPFSSGLPNALILNTGTFRKIDGGPDPQTIDTRFSNTGTGRIEVDSGTLVLPAMMISPGTLPNTQSGTIRIAPFSMLSTGANDLTNADGGVIGGNGRLDLGGKTLTNDGILLGGLGLPFTIDGNLTQGAGGTVAVQLGGTGPGQFDVLNVTGIATLGGTLNVSTTGGYVPMAGDSFTVIESPMVSGSFGAITNPTFPNNVLTPSNAPLSASISIDAGPLNFWLPNMSGNWDVPGNWSLGEVPTALHLAKIDRTDPLTITVPPGTFGAERLRSEDNNIIVNGTLGLTAASRINGALTMTGGTLQGGGAVMVNGSLSLDGASIASPVIVNGMTSVSGAASQLTGSGSLATSGLNMMSGSLTVTGGTTLDLTGGAAKTIGSALTIADNGTMNVTGNGDVVLAGGATLSNAGTLHFLSNADIDTAAGGGMLTNTGTVRKSASGGVTTIENPVALTNSGTFDVLTGTLEFASANNAFNNGTRFTGQGTHLVTGNSAFNGMITSTGSGLTLQLGDFTGSNAMLAGTTAWTGGRMIGTFSVPDGATLSLTGPAAKTVNGAGALLANSGTMTIADAGSFTLSGGANFTNNANGTATWTGPGGSATINAGSIFTNDGTVSLNATGVSGAGVFQNNRIVNSTATPAISTVVSSTFNNAGTAVNVDGGTLRLTGSGMDTGAYAIDAGTTLDFGGGVRTLNAGSSVTGAGTLLVSAGTATINAAYGATATTISGGTANFNANVTGAGTFTMSGGVAQVNAGYGATTTTITSGTANFNGAAAHSTGTLNLSGGTLTGTGNLTVTTAGSWSGGTVSGAVTIPAGATLSLIGDGAKTIDGAAASLATTGTGTITLAGMGNLVLNNGATLNNAGTLDIQSDADIVNSAGGAILANTGTGTLRKSAGAGTSTLGANAAFTLSNAGGATIDVQSGTLQSAGSFATNSGTINVAPGTIFSTAGAGLTNAGTLRGAGTIDVGGATLTNNAVVAPGTAADATGRLAITGNLTQGAAGRVDIELGGTAAGAFDIVTATGTATLGGTLALSTTGGYAPAVGDAFNIVTAGTRTGTFATTTKTFANEVLPTYAAGGLTLALGTTTANTWIFDVSDNWDSAQRWSQGRVPLATDFVLIDRPAGVFTVMVRAGAFNAATLTSTENVTVAGTLDLAGASTVGATLAVNGGRLQGAGPVTVNGTLALDGGTIASAGGVTVNGSLGVSGGASQLVGPSLTASGLAMTSGSLAVAAGSTLGLTGGLAKTIGGGATLSNSGRINLAGAANLALNAGGTLANNAGATLDIQANVNIERTVVAGAASTLTNAGTVMKSGGGGTSTIGGALPLASVSNGGTYDVAADNTLTHAAANTFNDGTRFTGAGMNVVTGNSTFNGTITSNGLTLQSGIFGGNASFAGTTTWTAGAMAGAFTIPAGATLNLTGDAATGRAVNGAAASLTTNGTVNLSGTADTTVSGGALWDNFGALNLGGAARIVFAGDGAATLVNRGTGVITDTSTSAAPITTAGATKAGKAFSNAGTFNKNAGSAPTQTLDVPMTNTGIINVRSGTLVATALPVSNGTLDVSSGTTFSTAGDPFTNSALGLVKGNGTIVASTFTNNGVVAPGVSPGTLTIAGNYVQGAGGTLAIELGGIVAGTDYDLLRVTGSAALNGALVITTVDGGVIIPSAAYDFMTYANRTGDFTTFTIPVGSSFVATPGPTSYRVAAPVAVTQEAIRELVAVSQKDSIVLTDRINNPTQAQNLTEEEKKEQQECR